MKIRVLVPFLICLLAGYCCISQNENLAHYEAKVNIDVNQQSFEVELTINYHAPESKPIDSLEFLIHENANFIHGKAEGLLKLEEVARANQGKAIMLYFEDQWTGTKKLHFHYTSILKEEDAPWGIDKITGDWIELSLNSTWLPILSSFNLQFTADIALELVANKNFEMISSGTSKRIGPNKFEISNTVSQIDLVIVGSPAFHNTSIGNISIHDHQKAEERAEFIAAIGQKGYEWLNRIFGKVKEIPPVKLVIAPRPESGYARKNFIILNDGISVKDTVGLANFITHEFAHFWSSGANPMTVHRWLDESIAEYMAWKFVQEAFSKQAFHVFLARIEKEAPTLDAVYKGNDTGPPKHAVMYRKGVAKLYRLEKTIGEAAMFTFLTAWFAVEKKETETFLALLEKLQGKEVARGFRANLGK